MQRPLPLCFFPTLQAGLELDQLLDPVVELKVDLTLGDAETALVRDVVHAALRFGVLTVDPTDRKSEISAHFLEVRLGRKLRDLDVNRGAHASAEVGRARGQVAKLRIERELDLAVDVVECGRQAGEDLCDVSALLHTDDAHAVLFRDPDQELLVVGEEDAPIVRPVAVHASAFEEAITLLEQEVISDHLLRFLFRHTSEGQVRPCEISR